jgi:hypothetical protein
MSNISCDVYETTVDVRSKANQPSLLVKNSLVVFPARVKKIGRGCRRAVIGLGKRHRTSRRS